jgi:hypothetical protein
MEGFCQHGNERLGSWVVKQPSASQGLLLHDDSVNNSFPAAYYLLSYLSNNNRAYYKHYLRLLSLPLIYLFFLSLFLVSVLSISLCTEYALEAPRYSHSQ